MSQHAHCVRCGLAHHSRRWRYMDYFYKHCDSCWAELEKGFKKNAVSLSRPEWGE